HAVRRGGHQFERRGNRRSEHPVPTPHYKIVSASETHYKSVAFNISFISPRSTSTRFSPASIPLRIIKLSETTSARALPYHPSGTVVALVTCVCPQMQDEKSDSLKEGKL